MSSVFGSEPHSPIIKEEDDYDDKSSTHGDSDEANDDDNSEAPNEEASLESDPDGPTIAENAFDSERSRALFEAIDQFQSCGAGAYIDIPQLVIVGGQSTGKSSLLQSLTGIPFAVGADCCTRFATRIVSRRTAPGTLNQVKVTIVPPEFHLDQFGYEPSESYHEYCYAKESLTGEEFSGIVEEVTTKYMGINPGKGSRCKNFATEVLKVEISGPSRSHFSILDIPGLFTNNFNVKKREMDGVKSMVVEYMKQPENIVICVADAPVDLARQDVFALARQYVDKTRLIGVFTKCDMLKKADHVIAVVNGRVDGIGQLLHHGWFVVRNRADGDEDDPAFIDRETAERQLFGQEPWTQIREARRGSTALKQYLGELLCNKIEAAFPHLLARLNALLKDAENSLDRLGEARLAPHQRRTYLDRIARRYEASARESLERPWLLESERARARNVVKDENEIFSTQIREFGHAYEFEDHTARDEDFIQRMRDILGYVDGQPKNQAKQHLATPATMSERKGASKLAELPPVKSSKDLLEKIGAEVRICGCTVLPGLVHPDVIHRLYQEQTRNWQSLAEAHLLVTAGNIKIAVEELLADACLPGTALYAELLVILQQFHDAAVARAMRTLQAHCQGDKTKMLQTTDPGFTNRLNLLQSLRMLSTISKADHLIRENRHHSVEDLQKWVFSACHHSTMANTVNEVHDALRVYYEFSLQSFIWHINNTIIEDFLNDPEGPLKALSTKYVYELPIEEVDRLGRESPEVIEERVRLDARIYTLRAAKSAAQTAMTSVSVY